MMASHSDKPVASAAERLKKAAREWGARPDQPEGAVIDAMGDLLTAFEDRLDTSHGLPLDKIEAGMRKAASAGLASAAQSFRETRNRLLYAGIAAAIAVGALAGGAAGYALGYRAAGQVVASDAADLRPAFQSGLGGAGWLADVVRHNDVEQLAEACRASRYQTPAGEACRVLMWTGVRGAP